MLAQLVSHHAILSWFYPHGVMLVFMKLRERACMSSRVRFSVLGVCVCRQCRCTQISFCAHSWADDQQPHSWYPRFKGEFWLVKTHHPFIEVNLDAFDKRHTGLSPSPGREGSAEVTSTFISWVFGISDTFLWRQQVTLLSLTQRPSLSAHLRLLFFFFLFAEKHTWQDGNIYLAA